MKKTWSKLCPGCLINGWNVEGDFSIIEKKKTHWFCGKHYNLRLQYEKDEKK